MEFRRFRNIALAAVLITAAQVATAMIQAPASRLGDRYRELCEWDSGWYESIVTDGYHSSIPPKAQTPWDSNVAFFPGYPILARALHLGLGLEAKLSLLIVAQLSCVAFWIAFLAILDRWKVTPRLISAATLLVLAHPASFFLVTGYSESLFMAAMLFFLLWSDSESRRLNWLAAAPGFVMSATRIVGLPLAVYPALKSLVLRGLSAIPTRRLAIAVAVAALSAMGCLLFFAYCQLRFGKAMLYMDSQRIGWGIVADYGALWKWREFRYFFSMDRFATLASAVAILALFGLEAATLLTARGRGARSRLPIEYCVFCLFYITLAGLKSLWFRSMIRYTLPWHVLILLCLAHFSTQMPELKLGERKARFAWLSCAIACVAIWYFFQLPHLAAYLRGSWFA